MRRNTANMIVVLLLLVVAGNGFALGKDIKTKNKIDSLNAIPYDAKIANTSQSVKWFIQNLKAAQKLHYPKGIADSYANLGLVYYLQGKYDKNTHCMLNAIRWYQKLKLPNELAQAYGEYGYQFKRRDLKKAVIMMQKGIKLAESNTDKRVLKSLYDNYGVLKEMNEELDSALFFYHKAMALKQADHDTIGIPYSANKIACVKLMQHQPAAAKKLFDYAYQLRVKINDVYGIAESLNFYAAYFKKIGNDKEAISYFNKAIQWSQKYHYPWLLGENYIGLSEVYERNKDFQKALLHYRNHVQCKDSILNIDIKAKQAELDTEYETEQKEKEILLQRAQIAEKNLWILGGFSMALLIGLIGTMLYGRQKQKNIQLQKDNELKDALLKIETQNKLQEQRLRISRDLHDNIGAQLTFIISSLDNLKYGFTIKDEKLEEKLTSISGFTKETIGELRDTIWAMNKNEITFEDLKARISNFIENAKIASQGIVFEFVCDGDFKEVVFGSVAGMNIYRIIQEAINNALKHARASQIKVSVFKEDNAYKIEITDNGKGFAAEDVVFGNGLHNLKKRANEINGALQVASQVGKGTTIVLRFNKT